MPRGISFTLTGGATLGLLFIQRYRFLTIDQSGIVISNRKCYLKQHYNSIKQEKEGLRGEFSCLIPLVRLSLDQAAYETKKSE
jgi:hypothetical protein